MPVIKILAHPDYCPAGAEITAPAGTSICEALLDNRIRIEHACEMSCACTTCHVIVRQGLDSLNRAEKEEEDLLDRAWGLEPQSRLSCQAIVAQQDLVLEVPRYRINHAKENHRCRVKSSWTPKPRACRPTVATASSNSAASNCSTASSPATTCTCTSTRAGTATKMR